MALLLRKCVRPTSLRHVVERYAGRVLALDLPAGKHQTRTFENQIDLSTACNAAAQPRRDISQIDEAHELEGKGFKRKAPDMAILGF